MIDRIQRITDPHRLRLWVVAAGVLGGAAFFGGPYLRRSSLILLGLGAAVLALRPVLGLPALVLAALVGRAEFGTGTAVAVNPATLLVPAMLIFWVLYMILRRDIRIAPSRLNAPLALFLLAGLLSLLIGTALWDPAVPRADNLIVVQLAQWAIFAFSAGAFWLTGNLITDEAWLRRLTFLFLGVAGTLAILRVLPITMWRMQYVATRALELAPFWLLLTAVAGGQLIFNRALSAGWRLFLVASLAAVCVYTLFLQRTTLSHWMGMIAAMGVLVWLRFPRLRWVVIILLLALGVTGFLGSAIFDFAGGQAEWNESGGSRLALLGRVIELTMRNPVTGLGPAAYRSYGFTGSLYYGGAFYASIALSSHNNYVDLFSHGGILGLVLFFWFAWEVARLGLVLRKRWTNNFAAGYVNGLLAAGAGALVLMALADWILPFVYNIGFPGFQASVLVWLFLGGLVALEQMAPDKTGELQTNDT
jgi:hypothetical protein